MEENSTKKNILFTILVILTIALIYMLLFPKKSYVKNRLNDSTNELISEVFNKNIDKLANASQEYLKDKDGEVTLKKLIEKNIIEEVKDSTNTSCSDKSKIKKKGEKLEIYLKCNDKEDTITINTTKNEKLLCLYEYVKKEDAKYSNWSEWSKWQTEEVKKDDLTKVETKVEKEEIKKVTDDKESKIEPIKKEKIVCPAGYELRNHQCIKRNFLNKVSASISYICPKGYEKNGVNCTKNNIVKEATKTYYCPSNSKNTEFELSNTECNAYSVRYINPDKIEEYYECEKGYTLKNNMCYKDKTEEEKTYTEVTYYRYKTRTKQAEKYDIKWSVKNDNDLLNSSYNMLDEVMCEF